MPILSVPARGAGHLPDFKVSCPTLAEWLKKALLNSDLENILLPATDNEKFDEVWSFVKHSANMRWLWIVLFRRTRQVVAHIIGNCSEQSCQLLRRAIPEGYKKAHS